MENIKTILIMIIAFTIVYLFGAFYSATFNISHWSEVSRYAVVLVGAFTCFISLILNKIKP